MFARVALDFLRERIISGARESANRRAIIVIDNKADKKQFFFVLKRRDVACMSHESFAIFQTELHDPPEEAALH